jgi:light-regulated signal transduction histidine kinase (bacteriophytochrome)
MIGHEVTVAVDGAEAWGLLQRESFPLVISDWMMPEMDGAELCRRIRASATAASPYTYVILLTARTERKDRVDGLYSGADDYLEKPLGKGELFARFEIARRILSMQDDLRTRAETTAVLNEQLVRQNDQLTSLNDDLEQFASIACHDLQEPLRKLQIYSSRLPKQFGETVGPKAAEFIGHISAATERMQALIRGLFILTQVDREEKPFELVDLGKIAHDVVSDLESRLLETGGRVEIDDELPTVLGDPLQIRQLLQNLIDNSLKYHATGASPVVAVNASIGERGRITVSDNGIGFDEKYMTKIFAPFQRLHGRGEYEGTGIGLAICKKIAERHGAAITCHSAPGCGSTFEIAFAYD